MPEPLLSVSALDAFHGDFQALYGIDLAVGEGEVVAIIGANGAGKSTFMRAVCGLLQSRRGEIRFRGEDLGRLRADQVAHRGLALVPEGRQLFPSLSVEENLVIGGRVGRKGPWHLESVFRLFPILRERRRQASTSLSGGQQQMVAIGRALMANPDLLLLDELSLGLAPVVIKDIYDALAGIVGAGMSAIVVEQDIGKALSVADRAYCFQEGRVTLHGAAATLGREEISRAYFGL